MLLRQPHVSQPMTSYRNLKHIKQSQWIWHDDRDNEYDGKIENDVALKWPSRLVVVLAFDVPKSIALYGTREEEIQSFLLKLENSFSRERLFASK